MNPGLIGLTGGIVGGIIGVAGGLLGTYFAIRNTKGPRERAFVIKASIACWILALAFVFGMCLIPGLYKLLLIPIYVVGLVGGILLWNKRQAQIRFEESKINPAPPAAPSTQIIPRKFAVGGGALILIWLAVLLAITRAKGNVGGGVLILMYLAILVIVSIIVIQIKRAAEPGIFGFIFDKLGEKKNPASPVTPTTQTTPRKCPQCGAELKPDVSEGLCPACLLQRGIATEGGAPPGTPPFTPPIIPELAKLFPQLEILELIGKGGMGAVYKARQPALDRFVALKILAPRSGGDLDFAERFTREARALARLSHPNIVAVYDFGQAGGLSYFIMEFVDGPNLRQVEQAGRLSPREALEIIPQICGALQFAHDEGIVHRDIKPENVLLDKKGRVKIADFGLAKLLGQEPKDFRLTGARDVVGTPHYMAPEQIEKPSEVDHRADIYSLGVVFYEMLTGELPLGKFQPPSSCAHGVQIDVRLDEVVLRSLEKEPSRRYQQVSQVKTDVETIVTTPANQVSIQRKGKTMSTSSYKPLCYGLVIGAVCLLIWLTAWLATRPPKFSLENIDSKIVRLTKPGTTVKEVIHVLGEPAGYIWGDKSHIQQGHRLPDNPPEFYVLQYPGAVKVAVNHGRVVELRSEGQGPGFTYRGKLHLGSSLDEVLEALGEPTETVVGKPIDFSATDVLYRDVDGRKGFDYYARPDQNIRCFFANDEVTALYVTLESGNR
jgi:serine/threonine protein kinase